MFYTVGQFDCNSTPRDVSICSLRESYQLVYYLLLGEPVIEIGSVDSTSPGITVLVALFTALAQAITTMISATGVVAIYYEIRSLKEGIGADSLAAIFE